MHDVQRCDLRIDAHEHSGDDREILRHVIGDGKSRQHAAGHEHLLANLHDFQQFGRVGIEIDHVAGFLRRLCSCVHRHADIGLSQRWRVIGAVAGHGYKFSLRLLFLDKTHLGFRSGLR